MLADTWPKPSDNNSVGYFMIEIKIQNVKKKVQLCKNVLYRTTNYKGVKNESHVTSTQGSRC